MATNYVYYLRIDSQALQSIKLNSKINVITVEHCQIDGDDLHNSIVGSVARSDIVIIIFLKNVEFQQANNS